MISNASHIRPALIAGAMLAGATGAMPGTVLPAWAQANPDTQATKNTSGTEAETANPDKGTTEAPVDFGLVGGIYTEPATKDLGEIGGGKPNGLKIRGWLEGYYDYSFNRPSRAVANANQGSSIIKGNDVTIEGRLFDVRHNRPTLNLAEVEIEKVPDATLGRLGFKLDVAAPLDTQKIIFNSINAASPGTVKSFEKYIQHASVGYLAPVGKGLRIDVGKFVTHIGGETIESIKNRNSSHAYFYSYAIPFQDTGVRLNYPFSPKLYGEAYLLRGWNVTTKDNNSGKTVGLSLGYTPTPRLSVYANYLGGPEQNNSSNRRDLLDAQIIYLATPTLQTMVNIDIASDKNGAGAGQNAKWQGVTFYARKSVNNKFFPTVRAEYYNDPQGFTTGVAQKVYSLTFTGDYRIRLGKFGKKEGDSTQLMLRPEIRYDSSDAPFFTNRNTFRAKKNQLTVGMGVVAYF